MVNERQSQKHISKEEIKKRPQNLNKKRVQSKSKKIKIKQADDKSARIKKAKKIRAIFSWTILIGILVGMIVFLCKAEMFEVCNIEITGNSQVSQEIVLQLSEINLKDNIFLSNITKAQNKISENPYVDEVTVKRILPDKIKIEIIEKQKVYMLQLDKNYAYINRNGDILEVAEVKLENLIILQGYTTLKEEIVAGNKLGEEDLERLEDLQQILKSAEKNEINTKISSINIKNKHHYILNLAKDKKIVYIGDTSSLATKMLRTKDILDKTIGKEGKIFVNGNFNKGFDPYFREESNT